MELNRYAVGELYHPSRTSWPETTQYNYRSGGHELVVFMNKPTSEEISSIRRGPCEFALFVSQPVILFCYRFLPGVPWGDAPYSIHMVNEAERTVPELPNPFDERALLSIVLVDAATGIIKVLRAVSLPPEFTAETHVAIKKQAELDWSQNAYDRVLNSLYRNSTDELVQQARIRCNGGA